MSKRDFDSAAFIFFISLMVLCVFASQCDHRAHAEDTSPWTDFGEQSDFGQEPQDFRNKPKQKVVKKKKQKKTVKTKSKPKKKKPVREEDLTDYD